LARAPDPGALRHRDGRGRRSGPALRVVRYVVALHRLEDGRRVKSVAVTGLGVVSPFGAGVKTFWEGISSGRCALPPITLIATEGFRCRIAAEVPAGIAGSGRRSRADRIALTAAPAARAHSGVA